MDYNSKNKFDLFSVSDIVGLMDCFKCGVSWCDIFKMMLVGGMQVILVGGFVISVVSVYV